MAHSNDDGNISGSSTHGAGSAHGAGSSHGAASFDGAGTSLGAGTSDGAGCSHRRGSSDSDDTGHGKGSPVLNYNVPAPWDDQTTTTESDSESTYTEDPDSADGNPYHNSTETLSGVLPWFEVELVKTHVARRYRLLMPRVAMRLLPTVDVNVTLRYGVKEWKGTYHGSYKRPVIAKDAWQPFVEDNRLRAGDICTFELEKLCDCCGVQLKVLLVKGPFDTPAERHARAMAGTSEEFAIVVD